MIAESDTGARNPTGAIPKKILFFVPLIWTLFQLWYASPLPFIFNFFVLNDTEARAIHLAFAIFLSYTAYPTFKSSPRDYIPVQDWVVALVGAFCCGLSVYFLRSACPSRPGIPTQMDLIVAVVGLILLLEATRRALGPPLMVVCGRVHPLYLWRPLYAGCHCPQGRQPCQGDVPLLARHRRCFRGGPRGIDRHGLHVRAVRRAARIGRRRQLLHPHRFRRARPSSRRTGQGRGGLHPA